MSVWVEGGPWGSPQSGAHPLAPPLITATLGTEVALALPPGAQEHKSCALLPGRSSDRSPALLADAPPKHMPALRTDRKLSTGCGAAGAAFGCVPVRLAHTSNVAHVSN